MLHWQKEMSVSKKTDTQTIPGIDEPVIEPIAHRSKLLNLPSFVSPPGMTCKAQANVKAAVFLF